MKVSKKLLQHSLYILLVCVFTSCSSGVSESADVKEVEPPKRVKVLENGHYDIIEVDGCQYISNDFYGGVTHLETCPNAH
jgi:uncharacterized membrane protein